MKSQRPLWLAILRGVGFWVMILAAAALTVVGYWFSATWMSYSLPLFSLGTLMLLIGVGVLLGALKYVITKGVRERSRSGTTTIVLMVCLVAVLLIPFVFRRRTVPLTYKGKTLAFAKLPLTWGDNEFPVYVGNTQIFSLWGDMFDGPWFIYPFADGQRFLCIDDDDTSVLVFIVDCKSAITNTVESFGWPPDEYTRTYIARRAPKVVVGSKGSIRLPNYAEVEEAAKYVEGLTPTQLEKVSFPTGDFGLYRFYIPKAVLLKELDANRHSVWP